MPTKRRVTLRDVASASGVSATTVSRALKNHRDVSKSEKERITQLAAQMGYTSNPYISSWMRQVRQQRQVHDREVVAMICHDPDHAANPWTKAFRKGAERFADIAGYRIDIFSLSDYPDAGALYRTLRSRGIRGVIQAFALRAPLPEESRQHSLVCWNSPLNHEKIDFVDVDYYGSMTLALEKLTAYGYRRIGYLSTVIIEQHTRWEAAYLYHQRNLPAKNRVPIFKNTDFGTNFSGWKTWLKAARPDVVICLYNPYYSILKALESVPADFAWATLAAESGLDMAGINLHLDMVGEAAARMVTRKMELNEIGPPDQPRSSIVLPEWQDGATAPPLNRITAA